MANALYTPFKEALLGGDRDWDANTVKLDLVDAADYTRNMTTHDFRDDVPGAARVATSSAFGSKTKAAGVADAADIVLSAVTGDVSEEIVIWIDAGGADSANPLILDFDTATGLPVNPNGGNINVNFNPSGIFAL